MVPYSAFMSLEKKLGPNEITRYNLYNSAAIRGLPAPGYTSGDAINAIKEVAAKELPRGYDVAWEGLTYDEARRGNESVYIIIIVLAAAKLNTKIARANFYPSIGIKAGVGLQAFKPKFLTSTPESLVYSLAGDIVGPLINRNAIKAAYKTANNKQLQAVYEYERAILNAYLEVANELSKIDNLKNSYDLKKQQVEALNESIDLSIRLFKSARAEYTEVLLTQREALESKIEIIETKRDQLLANVKVYKALGGGWN